MPSRAKNRSSLKRQPAKGGLPKPASQKSIIRRKRVRRLEFPLSFTSQLVISFRRFRTSEHRRSKRYKQLVFQPRLGSIREIAVAKIRRSRSRNFRSKKRQNNYAWLTRRAVMPVAIVLLIVTGVLYGGVFFNKSNKQTALNNSAVAVQATKPKLPQVMPRAEPSQLSIPSIAVNTSLIQTGRQADGTLQMPDRYDIAAWYHDSPAPGERGPAVIVGHVDNYRGIGVFWRLHELQPSDIIEVSRVDGTVAKFSVTAVKEYPQNNFPTKEIYGNLDYAGIRLITCGGPFDYQAHEYTDNIVVYGKLNPSS